MNVCAATLLSRSHCEASAVVTTAGSKKMPTT
jgi:hypothetical protein